MPDFSVVGRATDTVFLLMPHNTVAKQWLEENLDGAVTHFGKAVAVEHRYMDQITVGIMADGLTISWRPV